MKDAEIRQEIDRLRLVISDKIKKMVSRGVHGGGASSLDVEELEGYVQDVEELLENIIESKNLRSEEEKYESVILPDLDEVGIADNPHIGDRFKKNYELAGDMKELRLTVVDDMRDLKDNLGWDSATLSACIRMIVPILEEIRGFIRVICSDRRGVDEPWEGDIEA